MKHPSSSHSFTNGNPILRRIMFSKKSVHFLDPLCSSSSSKTSPENPSDDASLYFLNKLDSICTNGDASSNISSSLKMLKDTRYGRCFPSPTKYVPWSSRRSTSQFFASLSPSRGAIPKPIWVQSTLHPIILDSHLYKFHFLLKSVSNHASYSRCTAQMVMLLVQTLYQMPGSTPQRDAEDVTW